MKTSENGIALITAFEGFSPKACKCVPTEKYYTIGFGHYGKDVKSTDTITKAGALELLKSDLGRFEKKVMRYNGIYHYNKNEFDALVSFTFNCGAANLRSLLRNGRRNRSQIAEILPLYRKAGGKVLKGLERRRAAEKALFLER